MSSANLIRALNPRPGERVMTMTRVVDEKPGLDTAQALADALLAQLEADPSVDRIVVRPQIIRQQAYERGGKTNMVTAIAVVIMKAPAIETFIQPMIEGYEPEFPKLFQEFLFRAAQQRNAVLEMWCEKMLQDGEQGIAMIQGEEDTFIALHPRVPFGRIFEFPSKDSFLAWAERGYPTE